MNCNHLSFECSYSGIGGLVVLYPFWTTILFSALLLLVNAQAVVLRTIYLAPERLCFFSHFINIDTFVIWRASWVHTHLQVFLLLKTKRIPRHTFIQYGQIGKSDFFQKPQALKHSQAVKASICEALAIHYWYESIYQWLSNVMDLNLNAGAIDYCCDMLNNIGSLHIEASWDKKKWTRF